MSTDRLLWRRCRRMVAGLAIPQPFDADAFLRSVSAARGRPIEVLTLTGALASGGDVPCGVLISTARADYIGHPVGTTTLHAEHILFHEIAHLLCGHEGIAEFEDAVQTLLPDLSGELVRRVLGRSGYTQRQEQEAELVATLIAQRVRRQRGEEVGDSGLDSVFGVRERRRDCC